MKTIAVVVSAVLMLAGIGIAEAQEAQPAGKEVAAPATTNVVKYQTLCPIMGGEISKKVFADSDGKRVYFCCGGCPATFKKDPAKYIAKMKKDGIILDKAPAAKPATGTEAAPAPAKTGGACCE